MYCTICGREIDSEARFCDNCGAAVNPPQEQTSHYDLGASQPTQPDYGQVAKVPNYLVQAILVTIFCCLPAGVVAIVFAAQVNGKVAEGNLPEAQRFSRNARTWCWVSFGVGLGVGILYAVVMIIVVIAGFAMGF